MGSILIFVAPCFCDAFAISRHDRLYGVIAPFGLYRALKKAHAQTGVKQRYSDPAFQAMYGWMLRKYSGDKYYWPVMILQRTFVD